MVDLFTHMTISSKVKLLTLEKKADTGHQKLQNIQTLSLFIWLKIYGISILISLLSVKPMKVKTVLNLLTPLLLALFQDYSDYQKL